jgi:hypothetical protein
MLSARSFITSHILNTYTLICLFNETLAQRVERKPSARLDELQKKPRLWKGTGFNAAASIRLRKWSQTGAASRRGGLIFIPSRLSWHPVSSVPSGLYRNLSADPVARSRPAAVAFAAAVGSGSTVACFAAPVASSLSACSAAQVWSAAASAQEACSVAAFAGPAGSLAAC